MKSMTKIDKNLIIFSAGILLFAVLTVVLLQKFYPLLSDAISLCQSYISSISIPHAFRFLPFIILFAFFAHAILRLSISLLKARSIKRNFLKTEISSEVVDNLLVSLELKDKVKVVESKKLFAFCLGIKNPKIYLSRRLVRISTEVELEAILRHELYHLKNRDSLVMLAAFICEALFPFFPILSDIIQNYRIEREIKADKEAIRGIGKSYPIISVLKKMLTTETTTHVAIASMIERNTLEPRIKALVETDFTFRRFKLSRLFISFFFFIILGIVVVVPTRAIEIAKSDVCENVTYEDFSPNKNFSEIR